MIELHHFAQLPTQSQYFSNKETLTACLWVCWSIDPVLVDWKLTVLSFFLHGLFALRICLQRDFFLHGSFALRIRPNGPINSVEYA